MSKTIEQLLRPTSVAAAAEAPTRPFSTLMTVEGRWTGDERIIMVDGLSWDGLLPMPLTVNHEGVEEVVGRVDAITRTEGATADERYIFGKGEMFLGSELALQVEQLIEGQFIRGVSIETDAIAIGGVDPDDPALPEGDDGSWRMVTESARIRALSVVTTPAFAEAYITFGTLSDLGVPAVEGPTPLPADEMPERVDDDDGPEIIIAAGHVITLHSTPPAAWFAEPTDVDIEGALTITDDGRVYGLLAPSGTRHTGRSDRVMAPLGNVNYARFTRGETPVEGGSRVVTGNITMGCGHAPEPRTSGATVEHYDNSCALVATVAVGERTQAPYGVWVAGALLPGVTEDQVRRMMALQLSGHWVPSESGYGYDLLGALLVPVPGFAMARRAASVTMSEGAMVASAIPVQFENDCGCGESALADVDKAIVGDLLERVSALELAALRERMYS